MNGYNFTERVRKVLAMAREAGVDDFQILNAKHHEREASVIQAFDDPDLPQRLREIELLRQDAPAQPLQLPFVSRARQRGVTHVRSLPADVGVNTMLIQVHRQCVFRPDFFMGLVTSEWTLHPKE
mgnify:CR=1 FL=1